MSQAGAAVSQSSAIELAYRNLTSKSADLMARAARVMPGGNTRTASFYPPYPVVIERGDGAWVWDVDGRRYVDMFANGLSLIHGHNYPPVRQAIESALLRGTAWAGASRDQIAYAEVLTERLPSMERLRFTNSGSEAGMLAVKAARSVTGRPYVLKFTGAYHGSYPDLEAGLYGQADIPGRALTAPFNDIEAVERVLSARGHEIAAIVIEPVLVTGRVVAPLPGFLTQLQALARRHGALTLLDDCLMLRLAVGGSAAKFGLQPDLTMLGKFLGGGTPFGAVGGRADIMERFNPTAPGCLFHGGSFNGNPIGCAAGLATLRDLTAARIAAMDARRQRIADALLKRSQELGLDIELSGFGSVAGIAFAADPSRHEDDPSALTLGPLFHLACANAGVLLGPGGIIALSTVHDETATSAAIAGMSAALGVMATFCN
jgi:glutamate-1-semialdehyde 2,1-aminomutase